MAMSPDAARIEFSKMRTQISTIAQKVHELDAERNEYEYVTYCPNISVLCEKEG